MANCLGGGESNYEGPFRGSKTVTDLELDRSNIFGNKSRHVELRFIIIYIAVTLLLDQGSSSMYGLLGFP